MAKSKAPAFQFFVGDYLQDTRMLSLSAKGAWVDCLCQMWISQDRGKITYDLMGYARLFGCDIEKAKTVLMELIQSGVPDALPNRYQDITENNHRITLMSRRMLREEKERNLNRDKQNRYRNRKKPKPLPENNQDVTAPSSDSSLQPTVKKSKKTIFYEPPLDELLAYIKDNKYDVNAKAFLAFYDSIGWMVGKNKMKSWKATVTGWHYRDNPTTKSDKPKTPDPPAGWVGAFREIYPGYEVFDTDWLFFYTHKRHMIIEVMKRLKNK